MKLWSIWVISFAAGAMMFADERASCVSELRVPQYPPLARQARLTGTAKVRLTIGEQGEPKEISIRGVHRLLEKTARDALHSSRFGAHCKGQIVQLQFIFELQDPPKQIDAGHVLFRPPNVFVIRAAYFPVSGQSGQ